MGRNAADDLQEATANHNEPSNGTSPSPQKAIATLLGNSYAIGTLIAQKDGGGVKQPVYYIICALKNAETRYQRAERGCLAIMYAS